VRMTYLVHFVAGALGLVTGYVALYAAKGGSLHRRSGMLFVYTMLTMAMFGMTIAVVRGVAPAINVPAALLTSSLIVTALTTVRPLRAGARWLDLAGTLIAFAVGVTMLTWGVEAIANGGKRDGMPAFPFFMFGVVGMLAGIGDVRVMRSGPLTGAPRLARHLWRMCFALFIAALSAAVQFGKMIPKDVRPPLGVLFLPVLLVLCTMLYWLWRVRIRRSLRNMIVLRAPEPVLKGS
jgi:uncharacterized membrane protein